jgi:ATP-binding cassette, subfamily B, bacterial
MYSRDIEMTRDSRTVDYIKRVFYEKKYGQEIRLSSIRDILLKRNEESYERLTGVVKKYGIKIAFLNFIDKSIIEIVVFFGTITYITYCISIKGALSAAVYISMINAIGMMSWQIAEFVTQSMEFVKQGIYIRNIRSFLEYIPSSTSGKEEKQGYEDFLSLTLKNLSYTYKGAKAPAIRNISMDIKRGEKIALVGYNGSGKTTLVKLMMRLYDASEGEILINDKNIRTFDIETYRQYFSTVFQDFQIFSLTIAENVLMKNALNEERIKVYNALLKAGLNLESGREKFSIDSVLTKEFDDKGVVLSGGDSQKIAIARVFVKSREIIILDEPSSALDPITEFNMYNNMMEAARDKTVVFISHRLSSARMADKIYLLEQGEIVEKGTHEELMKLKGRYSVMFRKQAENYIDIDEEKVV